MISNWFVRVNMLILGVIMAVATALTGASSAASSPTEEPAPTATSTSSTASAVTAVTPRENAGSYTYIAPPTGNRVVYLTFDDGPSGIYTKQVLALLARYNAKATFFQLGQQGAAYPSLVRAVKLAGHKVGNHTYSHPMLTRLTDYGIRSQISRTDAVLGATRCVRPPYGDRSLRVDAVIRSMGKNEVMWTLDPVDWSRPGWGAIVYRVESRVRTGSVILMHDGGGDRSQTVAALGVILRDLKARGYVFGTLPAC